MSEAQTPGQGQEHPHPGRQGRQRQARQDHHRAGRAPHQARAVRQDRRASRASTTRTTRRASTRWATWSRSPKAGRSPRPSLGRDAPGPEGRDRSKAPSAARPLTGFARSGRNAGILAAGRFLCAHQRRRCNDDQGRRQAARGQAAGIHRGRRQWLLASARTRFDVAKRRPPARRSRSSACRAPTRRPARPSMCRATSRRPTS